MLEVRVGEGRACPDCGTEVALDFLSCPHCHRLMHAETLKRLAEQAGVADKAGDWTAALVAWRSARSYSRKDRDKRETVLAKVEALGHKADAVPGPRPADVEGGKTGWTGAGGLAGLGTLGLAIWKLKFLGFLILTKGKLLLLGLTKASTLFSMLATVGAYWTLWGWPFAIGLVLTTYVHEMGHVSALVRYGIKADAPMFIPGIGALIRARQRLSNTREEAQVGLAGPIWGLGSVLACLGLGYATGQGVFYGVAKLAAVINLFNLIPVWQLDGGHAFKALSKSQRWLAALAASAMWATSDESDGYPYVFTFVIMVTSAWRAAFEKPQGPSDRVSAVEYVALVVVLAWIAQVPTPLP